MSQFAGRPPGAIDGVETPEPLRRSLDIEDITNVYVVHPISNRLVPLFARLGIPPNAVSLAGMTFGILAGFAYYRYQNVGFAIAGFLLMIAWHVMDGVDGQLARLTQSQSQFGKTLDGICDYVTFASVYIGLALVLSARHGPWVWAIAVAAGLFHAVQAATYEVQRQEYNYWGLGLKSARFGAQETRERAGPQSFVRRIAARLLHLYQAVQAQAIGANAAVRRDMALTLEARPDRADQTRLLYRQIFAPAVRRWSILSANYRTLAIFIFALVSRPLLYFIYEIVVLSVVMVVLLGENRRLRARLSAAFA